MRTACCECILGEVGRGLRSLNASLRLEIELYQLNIDRKPLPYMQVDKLVDAGADVLSPVAVGRRHRLGTIVDYATYIYSQVRTAYRLRS